MGINTDLNVAPYFDDYQLENQYYRVLFKPGYAVQARELTQLQTMLQNQVEQFGDNLFKEGSIIKGCTFTDLNDLRFVKVENREAQSDGTTYFDPEAYVSTRITTTETTGGIETEVDVVYVLVGQSSGVSAQVISASRGFVTRPPNLNTFFIRYLNTTGSAKEFEAGETIRVDKYQYKAGTIEPLTSVEEGIDEINVVAESLIPTGKSFGISSAPGIVFQKGHFIYADEQILVVEKYSAEPSDLSVGYRIQEDNVSYLQDTSLYDNANGSTNENAPGADRLKLVPVLTKLTPSEAEDDSTFFALIRYQNGNAVRQRDVSAYNVLGDVTARRTYEESGNYILRDFPVSVERNYPVYTSSGSIADVNVIGDPQATLNAQYPVAVAGLAITDTATGDIWYYDGAYWHKIVLEILVDPGVAYVKGYRAESIGTQSFEVEPTTNTEIQTSNPVSFNYGNYVDVTGFTGHINIDLSSTQDLLDGTNTKIGECFVSNLTETRAYIWGVDLNAGKDFSDVAKIDGATTGEISVGNVLKGTDKRSFIFDTGMDYLKEVLETDLNVPIRGQSTRTVNNDEFQITAAPGTDFGVTQHNILVISSTGAKVTVTGTSTQLNNGQLTVALQPGAIANGQSVICYYDYRHIDSVVREKAAREVWLRLDHVGTRDRFSLGFPDVFEILALEDANGKDYKNSFRLNKNQKDQFYDLSSIEYIQGRPRPGNEQLRIQIKVFETNVPVGSESFYTVNSYVGVDEKDIPVYVSESGRKFNLRDCFDFRPQVVKESTMSYTSTDKATAPVMTITIQNTIDAAAPSFSGTYTLPSTDQFASADIEYYLPRYDVVSNDSYGKFNYIKGQEERDPRPPMLGTDQLIISEIFVPGAPILSPKEASAQGKREYAVRAKPKGTKRYTMKDIQSIENKIDRLVYYTSLNQLEQEVNNLTVLDENGLTRFKNGFIVDPFNDMSLANTRDPKFNAAVHFNKKVMTPSVSTFDLDLIYRTSTGATAFPAPAVGVIPEVGTLSRNAHVSLISQKYATGYRNAVSNFYSYRGTPDISPPYDATYDTTTNPVEIDFEQPFVDFAEAIQKFIPLTDAQISTNQFSADIQAQLRRARSNGGTVTFTDTFGTLNIDKGNSTNQVGDFVTNFQFQPYMSPRDIGIYVTGLRPNTNHYFFFDRASVQSNVCQGTLVNKAKDVERNGPFNGQPIATDENGTLRAVFRLPADTFFVGERMLEIVDTDLYNQIDSAATSRAKIAYRAYNFSVEKASMSTRMPTSSMTQTTSNRSVTFRPPPPPDPGDNNGDPLAQTFFLKKGMGRGSNTVAASKLDLYFKRKSSSQLSGGGGINGVTVMLREVVNGYPSSETIPFSKVHLQPSEVNISDDASIATTIEFEAPVILEVEKEYAFVIQPDANDPGYLVFTSKVGQNDLTPGDTQGKPIVQDWGDGVLFTSTNNSAWKSYQDEDVKFNLYRHDYNASQGSITLTNNNHEFFTVTDITGQFRKGEKVWQTAGTDQVVGMANANNTITRTSGANFDTVYAIGDFMKIAEAANTSNYDIFKVTAVSADSITANKNSNQTFSNAVGTPIVVGDLCLYDVIDPTTMYLEKSTARSGKVFAVGSDIVGEDSAATAEISSIDNITLSYVQPFIQRVNDSVTKTQLSGTFIPPAAVGTTYDMPMKFNDNNHFNAKGALIYSRTNNLSGNLKFEIKVGMENGGNSTSSPFIDMETCKLLAYKYDITNTPDATASFVSKVVELAEDFDAEDFNLILSAYRPSGSDIKCYIRAQNTFDSIAFDEVDWVELEMFEGIENFSSQTNMEDYREFRYRLPTSSLNAGVYQYISRAGTFKTYRKFAVRIDLLSPNIHTAPIIKDYRGIALT